MKRDVIIVGAVGGGRARGVELSGRCGGEEDTAWRTGQMAARGRDRATQGCTLSRSF
jgi:hypothetical protein